MTRPHLINYLTRSDVDTVLARVPADLRVRVRDIFFAGSNAVRQLGFVTTHGRRDITICSWLPPRVSLQEYMFRGRTAADFGAPPRGQWPPWAVRRKLLYDTLLHELGHLQVIDGRFASEGAARAFASEWHGRLYSEPFDHPDPVHNAPTDDERAALAWWEPLDKAQRLQLTRLLLSRSSRPPLGTLGFVAQSLYPFLRRARLAFTG